MFKILLVGCNGKMGKAIQKCVKEKDYCEITAGVDLNESACSFPVYSNFDNIKEKVNVIIDFSHPSVLPGCLNYAKNNNIPAVIATTGLSSKDLELISEASKSVAIFSSFNMSLGVNLLLSLSRIATDILGNDFDIEIIEKHHNQKIDAPSGTALMIANAINETRDNYYNYEFDRHSRREKRAKNEIGIHSIRGGNIVGEHEVIFAGHDEVITLTHQAFSKEVFAVGSINAAGFLIGKPNGLYNMDDLINKDCICGE